MRSGRLCLIHVQDVLVGDVIYLEPGDFIPVDGVYVCGHSLSCDESSATGESDLMRKTTAEESMAKIEAGQPFGNLDPFIVSGSKVVEGDGSFMVTAVGVHSSYGKVMMSLQDVEMNSPMQMKVLGLCMKIVQYNFWYATRSANLLVWIGVSPSTLNVNILIGSS